MKITIIDTKMCNLRSVCNALDHGGVDYNVSSDAKQIRRAQRVILPGVGSFGACMSHLEDTGLKNEILQHAIEKQRPLLGICLGMQLLASVSEEGGNHKGLDLIPGKIVRLKEGNKQDKIPNIGWSEVRFNELSELFSGIEKNSCFYHIHSFFYQNHHPNVAIASINFSGADVTVSVQKNNIFGVQFHPEKSHAAGIKLLQNFSAI